MTGMKNCVRLSWQIIKRRARTDTMHTCAYGWVFLDFRLHFLHNYTTNTLTHNTRCTFFRVDHMWCRPHEKSNVNWLRCYSQIPFGYVFDTNVGTQFRLCGSNPVLEDDSMGEWGQEGSFTKASTGRARACVCPRRHTWKMSILLRI